jgi:hypothetical protein
MEMEQPIQSNPGIKHSGCEVRVAAVLLGLDGWRGWR